MSFAHLISPLFPPRFHLCFPRSPKRTNLAPLLRSADEDPRFSCIFFPAMGPRKHVVNLFFLRSEEGRFYYLKACCSSEGEKGNLPTPPSRRIVSRLISLSDAHFGRISEAFSLEEVVCCFSDALNRAPNLFS